MAQINACANLSTTLLYTHYAANIDFSSLQRLEDKIGRTIYNMQKWSMEGGDAMRKGMEKMKWKLKDMHVFTGRQSNIKEHCADGRLGSLTLPISAPKRRKKKKREIK